VGIKISEGTLVFGGEMEEMMKLELCGNGGFLSFHFGLDERNEEDDV